MEDMMQMLSDIKACAQYICNLDIYMLARVKPGYLSSYNSTDTEHYAVEYFCILIIHLYVAAALQALVMWNNRLLLSPAPVGNEGLLDVPV